MSISKAHSPAYGLCRELGAFPPYGQVRGLAPLEVRWMAFFKQTGLTPAPDGRLLGRWITSHAPSVTATQTGDCTRGRRVRALSGSMGVRAAHARAPRGGAGVP